MRVNRPSPNATLKFMNLIRPGDVFEPVSVVDGTPSGKFYILIGDRRANRSDRPRDKLAANIQTGELQSFSDGIKVKVFVNAEMLLIP